MRWRTLKYLTGFALLQAVAVACSLINQPEELIDPSDGAGAPGVGGKGSGGKTGAGGSGGSGSGGKPGTGGKGAGGSAVGGTGAEGTGAEGGLGGLGGESSGGASSGGAGGTGGSSGSGGSGGVLVTCQDTSDPDCTCQDGMLVPKDVDKDGEGTILCEANPGKDCNDGDPSFVQNACGGCNKDLGGVPGDPCLQCGEFQCQGDSAVVCGTPSPAPRICLDSNTPRQCVDGSWVTQADCSSSYSLCNLGRCVECIPDTFRCDPYSADEVITRCGTTGSWESSWFASCYASSSDVCDATTGTCVTGSFHPRDADFELVPLLGEEPSVGGELGGRLRGRPTEEVFDLGFQSDFG